MIPWVDEQCRAWGAHKRWMLYAVEGYSPRSILGRLIEEGPGAGHGDMRSRVPIKDPPRSYAAINTALARMALTHELEKPILIVYAHYVDYGKAKQKAPGLSISLKQYWNLLHTAHAFIAGHLPEDVWVDVPRETESCTRNSAGNRVPTAA